MKTFFYFILVIVSACSTIKKPENVVFNKQFEDPALISESEKIYAGMGVEDRKLIVAYYYSYYGFSASKLCNKTVTKMKMPKIESLNIPALDFQESFSTVSDHSKLKGGLWSLNADEQSVYEIIESTPRDKVHQDSAVLIRSSDKGRIRYYICHPTGEKTGICTEDVLIKKLVNVEDKESFCKWVSNESTLSRIQNPRTTQEILQLMLRLK